MKHISINLLAVICAFVFSPSVTAREYHVSPRGNDAAAGGPSDPFRTINCAARKALPGDTVTVHSGTYREWVNPLYGGIDDSRRILYRAAEGEYVEIKGSEEVKDWKRGKDGVWKATLPNSFFGDYNPFNVEITGDWFVPMNRPHHTAEVYLNDVSLYEIESLDIVQRCDTLIRSRRDPDGYDLMWYAHVEEETTTIYARFGGADPRKERVEVAVRPTCFYPTREGINYLTIRGFHISQAATQWAAPTAEQIGMVAAHWCKGWIIEDNVITNSRCNGISLGKQASTGHNLWSQRGFDGATEYIECIFSALRKGWNRDNVGSHIIRDNEISYCEQTGICGSMGGAFCQVYGNHIHDIWVKCQFDGAEISGIKFHGAIDAYIHHNRIHRCQKGVWMDWMAQGSRVSSNLMYDNSAMDIYYEVDHGPFVCDNNIALSTWALWDMSEGGAYVHNFFNGYLKCDDQGRYTPYHLAHSTEVKGLFSITCGDDRFYNNVFIRHAGDGTYALDTYKTVKVPILAEDNVTLDGSEVKLEEDMGGRVFLTVSPAGPMTRGRVVDTERLGFTRLSNYPFEHPDGTLLRIDRDYSEKERSAEAPFVGPFDEPSIGRIRVW
jgi:hypothetical protein